MEDIIAKTVSGDLPWSSLALIILIVWATQLVTWVGKQLWKHFNKSKLPNSHDLRVWNSIDGIFSKKIIIFLRQHNFVTPFKRDFLDPLFEAAEYKTLEQPEFNFLDKDLSENLKNLNISLHSFSNLINQKMFCVENNVEYSCLPKDSYINDDERYLADLKEIHETTDKLVQSFNTLHLTANKKFNEKIDIIDSSPPQD